MYSNNINKPLLSRPIYFNRFIMWARSKACVCVCVKETERETAREFLLLWRQNVKGSWFRDVHLMRNTNKKLHLIPRNWYVFSAFCCFYGWHASHSHHRLLPYFHILCLLCSISNCFRFVWCACEGWNFNRRTNTSSDTQKGEKAIRTNSKVNSGKFFNKFFTWNALSKKNIYNLLNQVIGKFVYE